MQKKPFLKIRDLKEMQYSQLQNNRELTTPNILKKSRRRRSATKSTVSPPVKPQDEEKPMQTDSNGKLIKRLNSVVPATPKTLGRRSAKSARKEPPPSQLRINSFFKTCERTYKIEPLKEEPSTPFAKGAATAAKDKGTESELALKSSGAKKKTPRKAGRKRLFVDDCLETEDDLTSGSNQNEDAEWQPRSKAKAVEAIDCIIISSDDDEPTAIRKDTKKNGKKKNAGNKSPMTKARKSRRAQPPGEDNKNASPQISSEETNNQGVNINLDADKSKSSSNCPPTSSFTSAGVIVDRAVVTEPELVIVIPPGNNTVTDPMTTPAATKRNPKPCPPYKVIEGTTFAVDAFQFGYINGVTHYFLTHFHADHYIGLSRKFAMPLYLSTITARLVRTFIPIEEKYIHEMELNNPIMVDDIEITALDANHCPGAIMLLYKFKTGKCILHTGDFRAWHGMESEPAFWNHDIHTVYLDTTYLSNNYAFCTQYESIYKALDLMHKFREKHCQSRILYVCGSYVIGKERFWTAIAEEYQFKVWTEANRYKALKAINDLKHQELLVEDPKQADMHVIAMGKISYIHLIDYFTLYEKDYDMLLAIRPSGWEKDSKPQYRGKINIIGVEYSEHSSYEEMQRFVKFLKPEKVISTVPFSRDLMKTPQVPEKWYKYKKLQSSSNYQPRIDQYMGKTPNKPNIVRLPNESKGGLDKFVSPIKKRKSLVPAEEVDNSYEDDDKVVVKSPENDTMEPCTPKQSRDNSKIIVNVVLVEGIGNIKMEDNSSLKSEDHISLDNEADVDITQALNDDKGQSICTSITAGLETLSCAKSSDYFEPPDIMVMIPKSLKETANKESEKYHQVQMRRVSRSNSSELFESITTKTKKVSSKKSSLLSEKIPMSQKYQKRLPSGQPEVLSVASTMSENELSFQIELLKQTQTQLTSEKFMPGTGRLKASQSNPLFRSTTTSCASSTNDNASTSNGKRNANENSVLLLEQSEEIAPSQTTTVLENTPRPLRNRNQIACIPKEKYLQQKQTPILMATNELVHTPYSLKNKMKLAYLWQSTGDNDDAIAASQTSKDLEDTPRPLRNKRLISKKLSLSSKSTPLRQKVDREESKDLSQIMEKNEMHDMYNVSQLPSDKADALVKRELEGNVKNKPKDLLSSMEMNNNDIGQVKMAEQTTASNKSLKRTRPSAVHTPVKLYIDSSQIKTKGVDTLKASDALTEFRSASNTPSGLLAPYDVDADDDWIN